MLRLISKPYNSSGEWWLPDMPNAHVSGSIEWDCKCAQLELNNVFSPRLPFSQTPLPSSYPVLHGMTRDGDRVTLMRCLISRVQTNFNSDTFRQYVRTVSSSLIIGAHVDGNTLYRNAKFSVPGLHIWMAKPTMTMKKFDRNDSGGRIIDFRLDEPSDETFRISSINSDVVFELRTTKCGDDWTASVSTTASIRIVPDDPKPLDWYWQQMAKVTTLISFMSASPMSPDGIQLSTENGEKASALIAFNGASYCKYSSALQFFMRLEAIGGNLGDILNRWFEVNKQVTVASQLAAGVLSSESLAPNVEFLLLMQCMESLHRGTMRGLYMDPDKYKAIASFVVEAIPKDAVTGNHRTSLKSRIGFGNEISLRNRLKELVGKLEEGVRQRVLGENKKVLDLWTDTRNYFTHWDQTTKDNVLDGVELMQATAKIRNLLRILYLNLVGVPQHTIMASLENVSDESQYLAQILNSEFHKKEDKNSLKTS